MNALRFEHIVLSMTIDEIFSRLQKENPDPKIELDYVNDFTLLVAVVLSARTTDKIVNRATKDIFPLINTPEAMIELGEEKFLEKISIIGLRNTKAKNVIALSKILVEKYHSKVPDDFDSLISLPGVGRKSANVVLNSAFHKPTIGVDTHVFRVSNRLGIVSTQSPEQTCNELEHIIPDTWKHKAHHWLVLHGRYVCKSLKPDCMNCCISDLCKFCSES